MKATQKKKENEKINETKTVFLCDKVWNFMFFAL